MSTPLSLMFQKRNLLYRISTRISLVHYSNVFGIHDGLIPSEALLPRVITPIIQPENPRLAHIALMGPVNTGKSTLLNRLIGFRVSPTSSKAQTTRCTTLGIWTFENNQLIFHDTPGLLQTTKQSKTHGIIDQVDTVLYMLEAISLQRNIEYYKEQIKVLIEKNSSLAIIVNKIDLLSQDKEKFKSCIHQIESGLNINDKIPLFPISCKHGTGLNVLSDFLLNETKPNRSWIYSREQKHLISDVDLVKEIIREKIYRRLNQDIPYKIGIEVVSWKEKFSKLYIQVALIIPREGIRPILIGKNGSVLHYIQTNAQSELEQLFDKDMVHIQLIISKQ